MMEVTSPGSAGSPANGLPANGGYQIDPQKIINHLTQVCEVTLGATKRDLENAGSILSIAKVSDTTQRVQRWAESQEVLYIQKERPPGSELEAVLDESSMYCC